MPAGFAPRCMCEAPTSDGTREVESVCHAAPVWAVASRLNRGLRPANATTEFPRLPLNRNYREHAKIDANDPCETWAKAFAQQTANRGIESGERYLEDTLPDWVSIFI